MAQDSGFSTQPAFMFDAPKPTAVNRAQGTVGRMGVVGGNSKGGFSAAPDYAPGNGPDNAIPEFFNTLLGPKVAAAKRDRFYQGFAAARSGKTLDDIHKDQPWFARVFGDTEFDTGAAVFTASASTAELTRQMFENMDELKTKTPEEMGQWMNEKSQSMLTGDVMADAVIQKSFLEQSGPLLDAQSKANYAWKQETLATGQYNNMMSQARTYNESTAGAWKAGAAEPNSQPDPAKQAERERLLFDAFIQPQGQNEGSYRANLEQFASGAAREGLWHALNAMQETGLYQKLPPDEQDKIEKRIDAARVKFQTRKLMDPDIAKRISQVTFQAARGVIAPQTVFDAFDDINRQYMASTGDTLPLVPMSKYEGTAASAGGAALRIYQSQLDHANRLQEQAAARDATQAMKTQANDVLNKVVTQAVSGHYVGALVGQPGITKDMVDNTMNAVLSQQPERSAEILTQALFFPNGNYKSEKIANQIQNSVQQSAGAEWTPAFEKQYALWKSMQTYQFEVPADRAGEEPHEDVTSGRATAQIYFGDYNAPMETYDHLRAAGSDQQIAYKRAFGEGVTSGMWSLRSTDPTKLAEARSAITDAVSDQNAGWMHPFTPDMSESTKAIVANAASKYFMDLTGRDQGVSTKDAALMSINMLKANGGNFANRYFWQDSPGQDRAWISIGKVTGSPKGLGEDLFVRGFDEVVTNKLKRNGIEVSGDTSLSVLRLPDDTNGPNFAIIAHDGKGQEKTITLSGKDMIDKYNEAAKESIEKRQRQDALLEFKPVPDIH